MLQVLAHLSVSSPSFLLLPAVVCFSELSFITEPSDITVLPKQPAVLDCQAHGQPPVTIRWLKNGVRLAESEHVHLLPNGSLYIPKIKHTEEESDEGFYQCLSQNKYGAILSQRSHLTIAREYGCWNLSHYRMLRFSVLVRRGWAACASARCVLWTFRHVRGLLTWR